MVQEAVQSKKLTSLFHGGQRFNYQKGKTILQARETPRGIYLIEEGIVKMYSLSKQDNEHIVDFLGPGDLFPIIWLFRNSVRSAYYEAIAPTTLWMIPYETFRESLEHNPDMTSEVLQKLVDRYYLYVGRIDNLLYSDALERSVYRVLSLANRFGVKTKEGIVLDATISHEHLAHSISTTRETFGRSMARLQKKGLIGYDSQRHLVIKDLPGLAAIIGRSEAEAMWPVLMRYDN